MKLSPYQLRNQDVLHPVYHLFGAELLIIEEALNDLRILLREGGYEEREKLSVEPGFDWNTLLAAGQSLSLFATRRIIELRMPTAKPGAQGAKALIEYCQAPPPDTILLVISGEINRASQNSKWFKALDSAGASIEAPRVQNYQIVGWIEKRLQREGIRGEPGVAKVIAHYVEGNLLAAAQEINFLALHCMGRPLSIDQVQKLISDQARFTSFAFVDACLAGKAARVVRILNSLKGEKVEPILIVSALSRESSKMVALSGAQAQGVSIRSMFRKLGIWASRERLVNGALERVAPADWLRIHHRMSDLDSMVKGQKATTGRDIWEEIEYLGLAMSGYTPALDRFESITEMSEGI